MRPSVAISFAIAAIACSAGGHTGPAGEATCTLPYPAGPYGTSLKTTLSDYSFTGLAADGRSGTITLGDHLQACETTASLLVVRIGASWCGTCQWQASHAGELLSSDVGSRIQLLDVLVRGAANVPAAAADATAWRALQDHAVDIALDPNFTTSAFVPPQTALPRVLLVDARTMTLVDTLAMPTEDALEDHARAALAALDGQPTPPPPTPTLVDGRFSRDQWDLIAAMTLDAPPPPDPTNMYADVLGVSSLGSVIVQDPTLSPSQMVSCESCHEPARQFTDGRPTSPEGVGRVPRNSPSLTVASYQPLQFWDGRADSLWAQALVPMENPNEFGSSRLFIAHDIYTYYQAPYEALFGPLPDLTDTQRFPPSGMPGDAAWESMASADQETITRIFVNIGKSLEAYERSIRGTPFALDEYAAGDLGALTDAEKDGLLAYLQAGCAECHWGPRMTDDAFHVLRFPTGEQDGLPDQGRIAGIPLYLASAFTAGSTYSDDPSLAPPAPVAGPWTLGAFKTPGLRNVYLTSPYGHGGNYPDLTDVVELHRTGGLPAGSPLTIGDEEPWVATFPASQDVPIVTFLQSLIMVFAH